MIAAAMNQHPERSNSILTSLQHRNDYITAPSEGGRDTIQGMSRPGGGGMSDPINFGLKNGRDGNSSGLRGPLDQTLNT